MADGTSNLFELEVSLTDARLSAQAQRLVGFKGRYERIRQDLRLLIDKEGLEQWSRKHYSKRVSLLDALQDRYPLIVFHGDVGTGKTATAESIANELAKDLGRDAMLFKLSTRVRGSGNVGEMSTLINQAFEVVAREAGKAKLAFLIIDEADSLASSRTASQSHHEDKVAVNTLIQKIDDVRRFNGRVLVILCSNRYDALDPAILRRAAYVEQFNRPGDAERLDLLKMDCGDLGLNAHDLDALVSAMGAGGPHRLAYTYSDIRTRVLPEALALAYPSRPVSKDDILAAVRKVAPSPSITPQESQVELKGRRIHIAGSAGTNEDEGKLAYAHELVSELTFVLANAGAKFVLSFGAEPRLEGRQDGPSIIFDWSVAESVERSLTGGKAVASGEGGRLGATIATSKTERQIPDERRPLFEKLRDADALSFGYLASGWTAGAVRRDRQATLGDVLIGIGGGEGIEHLARAYAARGKPVVPLDIHLGSSKGDGSGGAARLFERALETPADFFTLAAGHSAPDLLGRTNTREGHKPIEEVVASIIKLLKALEPPKVFYVRLLNDTVPEFASVESYFRDTVDPFVRSLGLEFKQMGIGRNEHAWMNEAIFDSLHHSSIVLVDLTTLRPNLFMELGYALGNRQRVIVTAKEGTNFPFDSFALEAFLWKETDAPLVRMAKLKAHWERNIEMPALVKTRGPR